MLLTCQRLLWIGLWSLASTLTIIIFVPIVNTHLNDPDFENFAADSISVMDIDFPAVTICPVARFDVKKVKDIVSKSP